MEELTYQRLTMAHAEALIPIWGDREVIRFTSIEAPCTLEEIRERIERLIQYDVFAVCTEEGVIGVAGCPCMNAAQLEYGLFYQFRKESWGHGCATAPAKWLVRCMGEKYGNPILYADVIPENTASEKILKRLGFSLISCENGFVRDGAAFQIHRYRL